MPKWVLSEITIGSYNCIKKNKKINAITYFPYKQNYIKRSRKDKLQIK